VVEHLPIYVYGRQRYYIQSVVRVLLAPPAPILMILERKGSHARNVERDYMIK